MEVAPAANAAPVKKIKKTKTVELKQENMAFLVDTEDGIQLCNKIVKKDKVDWKIEGRISWDTFKKTLDEVFGSNTTFNKLSSGINYNQNLLVHNAYAGSDGTKKHLVVLQYSPRIVTIDYIDIDKNHKQYKLPLPYVQIYVGFRESGDGAFIPNPNVVITCSFKPIKNNKDQTYHLPLNNLNRGIVCWGSDSAIPSNSFSPVEYAERVAVNFFSLSFNSDLMPLRPIDYRLWETFKLSDIEGKLVLEPLYTFESAIAAAERGINVYI